MAHCQSQYSSLEWLRCKWSPCIEYDLEIELMLLVDGRCLISPNLTNCLRASLADELRILGSCVSYSELRTRGSLSMSSLVALVRPLIFYISELGSVVSTSPAFTARFSSLNHLMELPESESASSLSRMLLLL